MKATVLKRVAASVLLAAASALCLLALPADAQSYTVLHSFVASNLFPSALIQETDGNFYGTTRQGGTGYGSVFRVTPAGTLTTVYAFSGSDGSYPQAGLVQGTDGNFYGTTESCVVSRNG